MCIHSEVYRTRRLAEFSNSELLGKVFLHDIALGAERTIVYRVTGLIGPASQILIADELDTKPIRQKGTGINQNGIYLGRSKHRYDILVRPENLIEVMQGNGLDTKHLRAYGFKEKMLSSSRPIAA